MSRSSADEAFSIFLQVFGDGFDRQYVPVSVLESFRGRLPDQLLSYWEQYGWCGYADGLFWTVNPQDYDGVLESWLIESGLDHLDRFHVIARSACGFHAIRPPSPPTSGHPFHAHPARQSERSDAGSHC